MDQATKEFFRRQFQEPENQVCADVGTANPQWASVSHGCYISMEASGIHRSLGVHISFVRSTTMDSWKPIQLKVMELGGNQKLKAFFRQHGIPDDMPILQKYTTRAAEWYRRNLRALAEGAEPPPPLPEGTGHLPGDYAPTNSPAFARPPSFGMMSAGGAFASDARLYHGAGTAERSEASTAPPRPMDAYGSDGPARQSRRAMDGFGSDGPARSSRRPMESFGSSSAVGADKSSTGQDDFLSGILGPDVGAKVSTGVWSAVGLVGSLATKAKSLAENKVQQAQEEGWLDKTFDAARQGVSSAVEAGKATVSYVNENGGQAALGKTAEVLGSTAKRSITLVGSGADWLSEQMSSLGHDSDTTGRLQAFSTGRMEGFGSDCPPRSVEAEGSEVQVEASSSATRFTYHSDPGPDMPPRPRPLRASAGAKPLPGPPAKAADVWNDGDWGDWS